MTKHVGTAALRGLLPSEKADLDLGSEFVAIHSTQKNFLPRGCHKGSKRFPLESNIFFLDFKKKIASLLCRSCQASLQSLASFPSKLFWLGSHCHQLKKKKRASISHRRQGHRRDGCIWSLVTKARERALCDRQMLSSLLHLGQLCREWHQSYYMSIIVGWFPSNYFLEMGGVSLWKQKVVW